MADGDFAVAIALAGRVRTGGSRPYLHHYLPCPPLPSPTPAVLATKLSEDETSRPPHPKAVPGRISDLPTPPWNQRRTFRPPCQETTEAAIQDTEALINYCYECQPESEPESRWATLLLY